MKIPIIDWLAENPILRSYSQAALNIVSNLLAGTLMIEISDGKSIKGELIPYSVSFYFLIVVIYSTGRIALKGVELEKLRVENTSAKDYVIKSCLQDYAIQCSKLIREGKLNEFHSAVKQLEDKK